MDKKKKIKWKFKDAKKVRKNSEENTERNIKPFLLITGVVVAVLSGLWIMKINKKKEITQITKQHSFNNQRESVEKEDLNENPNKNQIAEPNEKKNENLNQNSNLSRLQSQMKRKMKI